MEIRKLVILAAIAAASNAWAINKCTQPDGQIAYQDAPCVGNARGVTIKTAPVAPTTSGDTRPIVYKAVPVGPERANEIATSALAIAKASMKDPDSVKAKGIRVFSFDALGRNYVMTCGEINAKNGYGGYVGFQPFWVYDGVFTQTYDHYLPTSKTTNWLMGMPQTECLSGGTATTLQLL